MQEQSAIQNALDLVLGEFRRKGLVKSWSWDLGEDHEGEAAIFVYIVMRDPPRGNLKWADFKPIHDRVKQKLRDVVPARWPYVRVRLASEERAAREY